MTPIIVEDGYLALTALGVAVVVAELLISTFRWHPTARNRAMLAAPLWAAMVGAFLAYRLAYMYGWLWFVEH